MKPIFLFLFLSLFSANAQEAIPLCDGKEGTLINGVPADPKEWPASVYASMGSSRCSATVIGKKVLLIAAHCVSNGGTASFTVGPNRYSSKCTHSPHYRNNSTADWALCAISNEVTGIEFESINQDASRLSVGLELMLTGYGCTQPGGSGGNDGIYRIAKSPITSLPSGTDNDIVTAGGGALCFGDSGGPSFLIEPEKRFLTAVNSRGDISTTSYLSALHTDQFKTFLKSWMDANQLEVCGVSEGASDCRNKPVPPPTPPPGPPSPPSPSDVLPFWVWLLIGFGGAVVIYLVIQGIAHMFEDEKKIVA